MDRLHHPKRFFLGANTSEGFVSYYGEFTAPGDYLRCIKGGPGNGKSTLMRRIARAAEEKGLSVEYALCSGDPDSLDGIYIRELRLAYVDATSPHVQEPAAPGATGQYLDLSGCYQPGLREKEAELTELFGLYRAQYARAYALLQAAALASPESTPGLIHSEDTAAAVQKAVSLCERLLRPGGDYTETHRFLSAHTCQGRLRLWEAEESEEVCALDNEWGLAPSALEGIRQWCRSHGCPVILCPDPLRPDMLEAVLVPEQCTAFLSVKRRDPLPGSAVKHLRLDALIPGERLRTLRSEFRAAAALQGGLITQAEASLREAKRLHDQLEAVYAPFVDFSAVDEILQQQLAELDL